MNGQITYSNSKAVTYILKPHQILTYPDYEQDENSFENDVLTQ
jgi:hypothetical protein